jgi:hypothetical protein
MSTGFSPVAEMIPIPIRKKAKIPTEKIIKATRVASTFFKNIQMPF